MKNLSLYVHIPFCSSRCHYCNFYFETGWSPRVLSATLLRTLEEARNMLSALDFPRISTIYLGGGTPSIIPAGQLSNFIEELLLICKATVSRPVFELEMEANPESLTEDSLTALADAGANAIEQRRLSLGVQSFDAQVLADLGRRSSARESEQALVRIRDFNRGRTNAIVLNTDLIYGAPIQSPAAFRRDLEQILKYNPEGISLYELTVESGTPLDARIRHGKMPLPRDEFKEELWHIGLETLEGAGYRNYEVSNFARPGQESRHNFAYWSLRPYLGIGPGAVSTLPAENGNVVRLSNPNLFAYQSMDLGFPGDRESETICPQQLFIEFFITGLRTIAGVSIPRLVRVFGPKAEALARELAVQWQDSTIASSNHIILQDKARYAMDRFLPDVVDISERLQDLKFCNFSH